MGGLINPPGVIKRLGQVASRCMIPNDILQGYGQLFSRSSHVVWDDVNAIVLVYANIVNNGSGVEGTVASGATLGSAYYSAAVESPMLTSSGTSGTQSKLTQVTFGGQAISPAVAAGSLIISDMVTLPTKIPKGGRIRLRQWVGTTSTNKNIAAHKGGNMPSQSVTGGGGDDNFRLSATAYSGTGTGALDQTMSVFLSAPSNPTITMHLRPVAILAFTSVRSFVILGDSRSYGTYDIASDGMNFTGMAERLVGRLGPYINLSFFSDSATNFSNVASGYSTLRRQLIQYCTDAVCAFGTNDMAQPNVDSVNGAMRKLKELPEMDGKSLVGITIPPRAPNSTIGGTSTDFIASDYSDQVVSSAEALRVSWNTYLRTGQSCLDRFIEYADLVESSRNSGKWKAGGARKISDGSITAAAPNILNSATANFTTADIGQPVIVLNAGYGGSYASGTAGMLQAYITGINSATQATLSLNQTQAVDMTNLTAKVGPVWTVDGIHETAYAYKQAQENVKVGFAL